MERRVFLDSFKGKCRQNKGLIESFEPISHNGLRKGVFLRHGEGKQQNLYKLHASFDLFSAKHQFLLDFLPHF